MQTTNVNVLHNRINTRRVKVLLAERGWTMTDLSHALGVSIAGVSSAVTGRRPTSKLIPYIAIALEVPLAEILLKPELPVHHRKQPDQHAA